MNLYSFAVTLTVVACAVDERAPANGEKTKKSAVTAAPTVSRGMMRFMVLLDRQLPAELFVEVVDREGAVDPHAAVRQPLDRLVREVELVLDLPDDLLQQVLERDDPLEVAVLVDDDRHVLVRPPELGQQRREILRLGDDVRRPHDRLD